MKKKMHGNLIQKFGISPKIIYYIAYVKKITQRIYVSLGPVIWTIHVAGNTIGSPDGRI